MEVECAGAAPAHLVIIAGRPLGEEVAQHGPFVMNTQAEIRLAIEDFRRAQNGFETLALCRGKQINCIYGQWN